MTTSSQGATAPIVFDFQSNEVRIIEHNGEPWFVAADVCAALGYKNTSQTIGDHLDDDEKGVSAGYTLGGDQSLTIISESGLYALVLRSRKPEARQFAKWVTRDVLPSIRQTGRYAAPQSADRDPPIDVRTLLLSGQSDPTLALPADVQRAIDQRAFALAHEAYELCREHLARRVAYTSVLGQPRVLDRAGAFAAIHRGQLGDALAHAYGEKLRTLADLTRTVAALADQAGHAIDAALRGDEK